MRHYYGPEGLRYGRAFTTATDRVGLSDTFTRELRAEVLRSQQTVGASSTWLVKQFATATATASASAVVSRSDSGHGALVSGALDHQAADWSAGVQGRTASRNFVQLGQGTAFGALPRAMLTTNIVTSIGNGGKGVNYVQQTTWQGDRFRSVSVNHGRSVGVLGHLRVFAAPSRRSICGRTAASAASARACGAWSRAASNPSQVEARTMALWTWVASSSRGSARRNARC